jgi:protein associated with RNAse G/E
MYMINSSSANFLCDETIPLCLFVLPIKYFTHQIWSLISDSLFKLLNSKKTTVPQTLHVMIDNNVNMNVA